MLARPALAVVAALVGSCASRADLAGSGNGGEASSAYDTASGASDDSGPTGSGCALDGEEAEVVACDTRGTRSYATDGHRLYWITGQDDPSVITPGLTGPPRLYSTPLSGGTVRLEAAWDEDEGDPWDLAIGDGVVVATKGGLWALGPDGTREVIDDGHWVNAVRAVDEMIVWSRRFEGTIWKTVLGAPSNARELVWASEETVWALDARPGEVAWVDGPPGRVWILRNDEEEPTQVGDTQDFVRFLRFHGDHLFWSEELGRVRSVDLTREEAPRTLVDAHVSATALDGTHLYYAHLDIFDDEFGLRRMSLAGGAFESLVAFDPEARWPMALLLHEGYLYWSDAEAGNEGRVMRLFVGEP